MCTRYLLSCPVLIYATNHTHGSFFECSFFYRFYCDMEVLRDAILPFVANPDQEPAREDTEGQLKPQEMENETNGDPEEEGSDSWWWVPSWRC